MRTVAMQLVKWQIKWNSIVVYATKELSERRTYTKQEEVIDKGIIL